MRSLRITLSTMSDKCRGFAPISYLATGRSAIENPADGESKSSMILTTDGVLVDKPNKRPAVSEETTVEFAPDCNNKCRFSISRTAAEIFALLFISRADNVANTLVSSLLVATTTVFARSIPAIFNTSDFVPEPCTVTISCASATRKQERSGSTTTISRALVPSSSKVCIADCPFVPKPMMIVWSCTCFLHC